MFDKILNHNEAKQLVKEVGWDGFLDEFKKEYEPLNLYTCSTFWEYDSKYICKFKGTRGDIIIGWEGVHDRD